VARRDLAERAGAAQSRQRQCSSGSSEGRSARRPRHSAFTTSSAPGPRLGMQVLDVGSSAGSRAGRRSAPSGAASEDAGRAAEGAPRPAARGRGPGPRVGDLEGAPSARGAHQREWRRSGRQPARVRVRVTCITDPVFVSRRARLRPGCWLRKVARGGRPAAPGGGSSSQPARTQSGA
jgi:hypothetical protein